MGKNASKNKGSNFEREIANDLTKVFGYSFIRNKTSGAFLGGVNASRKETLSESQILLDDGDIIPPDELSHISIECKFYKDFAFNLMLSENALLDGWIKQAEQSDKIWFLIWKINRRGIRVTYSINNTSKHELQLPDSYCIYKDKYIICDYDGFFECNKDRLLSIC